MDGHTYHRLQEEADKTNGNVDSKSSLLPNRFTYHDFLYSDFYGAITRNWIRSGRFHIIEPRGAFGKGVAILLGNPGSRIWVDSASGLILRHEIYEDFEYKVLFQRVDFLDYRDFSGVLLPLKITLVERDKTTLKKSVMTITVDPRTVKVNQPISADLFTITFKPGTYVNDRVLGQNYIISESGEREPVRVRRMEDAVEEMKKKAEAGDAETQFYFGLMYETGRGAPKDDTEAVKWYLKAAEQGYAESQWFLAKHYGAGIGVPKDGIEALAWANLAVAGARRKETEDTRSSLQGTLGPKLTLKAQQRSKVLLAEIARRKEEKDIKK